MAAWDRDDELPAAAVERLVELGLPGAMVPAAYGGQGLTVTELVPVWRALSRGWISLTGAVNPTGLATALLVRHGTEAQRERWLPAIAAGDVTASFSITEPQAGSDLGRIEARATPLPGGGFLLDGDKRWVAGGVSSDVVFLLAELPDAGRPACIVLPADGRGTASWEVAELDKIGYRGVESAAYRFAGHEARGAEVLGGPDRAAAGAGQMLDALDVGRVNVACRALGIIDRALAIAVEEANGREVGDGLLREHTHAQLRIGEIRVRQLAAEALTVDAPPRRSTRAPTPPGRCRPRPSSPPPTPRSGPSTRPRGWPRAAPTPPTTSWPACAATPRRPRSARAPTTPCSWRSGRAALGPAD